MKYDYMELLQIAYPIRNIINIDELKATNEFKCLEALIGKITKQYRAKEKYDHENLRNSISLFFMTGTENPPLRMVEFSTISSFF